MKNNAAIKNEINFKNYGYKIYGAGRRQSCIKRV